MSYEPREMCFKFLCPKCSWVFDVPWTVWGTPDLVTVDTHCPKCLKRITQHRLPSFPDSIPPGNPSRLPGRRRR